MSDDAADHHDADVAFSATLARATSFSVTPPSLWVLRATRTLLYRTSRFAIPAATPRKSSAAATCAHAGISRHQGRGKTRVVRAAKIEAD